MKPVYLLVLLTAAAAAQSVAVRGAADPLSAGESYVLGPGDKLVIRVTNTDQIGENPFRIEPDGTFQLPLLGLVHAGGQTVEELEAALRIGLLAYVRQPQVSVSVVEFRTQPVTLSGDFRSPGIYELMGRHTLTEMLAAAGGLAPNAGRVLHISRQREQGPIGLPNERLEANGTTYVAALDISLAPGERNPADDFLLKAFDVIEAVTEDPIYVSGAVAKIGPVALGDHKTLGLYQVINLAGGLTPNASKHIKIYRPRADSSQKQEIAVNLDAILKGEQPEFELLPRDAVVVETSAKRTLMGKAGVVATAVLSGILVAR